MPLTLVCSWGCGAFSNDDGSLINDNDGYCRIIRNRGHEHNYESIEAHMDWAQKRKSNRKRNWEVSSTAKFNSNHSQTEEVNNETSTVYCGSLNGDDNDDNKSHTGYGQSKLAPERSYLESFRNNGDISAHGRSGRAREGVTETSRNAHGRSNNDNKSHNGDTVQNNRYFTPHARPRKPPWREQCASNKTLREELDRVTQKTKAMGNEVKQTNKMMEDELNKVKQLNKTMINELNEVKEMNKLISDDYMRLTYELNEMKNLISEQRKLWNEVYAHPNRNARVCRLPATICVPVPVRWVPTPVTSPPRVFTSSPTIGYKQVRSIDM
eukprot:161950_1